LADGTVSVRSFDRARLNDAVLHRLMQKTRVVEDPKFVGRYPGAMPTRLTVRTESGREYTRQVDCPLGHPGNPMSDEDVEAKFRSLASGTLGRSRADRIIDAIWALDALEDVGTLIPLLKVPERG
jgi:2-methylcitrate dehydratase